MVLGLVLLGLSARADAFEIEWQRSFGGTNSETFSSVQQTSDGGYILCGYSPSGISGSKTSTNYGSNDYWILKLDADGNQVWERSFGGTSSDVANWVVETNGAYVICGASNSGANGNKANTNFGPSDIWVIKLDAGGNKLWEQSYGGTSLDSATDLERTDDGGYIIAGISLSQTNGNKTAPFFGGAGDGWAIKINASGNIVWDQSFGGTNIDGFRCVSQAADGGYLFGGNSWSGVSGNKTSPFYGGLSDCWIVKTDADGNKQWEQSFGGDSGENIVDMQPTPDGGWILGGYSSSPVSGTKTSANHGQNDYWIIKVDANGNQLWENSFGGSGSDQLASLHLTADGGYIAAGQSGSGISGNKTNASFGTNDYWVIKLDENGNKIGELSFGGTADDTLRCLQPTSDGGYILGGYSVSGISGNKSTSNYGGSDYWVIKIGTRLPRLAIRPSGNNVIVAWPSPSDGFELEQNDSIGTTNWSAIGLIPDDDGTNKSLTLPVGSEKNFFRLRRL